MTVKDGIRKSLKVLAVVSASLLAVVIIVIVLLLVRPVREKILDIAVSKAQRALPGDISLSDARWPSPGILEIDGMTWIDGGDTLAAVGELRVAVDLSELLRKDVHVRELTVRGIIGDIPAIAAGFSAPADSTSDDEETGDKERTGGGFPRAGSMPGIPSIAIDRIEIDGRRILAADGIELIGLKLRWNRPSRVRALSICPAT